MTRKKLFSSCFFFVAPTAAPWNFQVSDTSSTSLRVTWSPPPRNETHGIIRQYNVRYRKRQCNPSTKNSLPWIENAINGNETSFDIVSLAASSFYEVKVRAVTIKNGIWSEPIQGRTSKYSITLILTRTLFGLLHQSICCYTENRSNSKQKVIKRVNTDPEHKQDLRSKAIYIFYLDSFDIGVARHDFSL